MAQHREYVLTPDVRIDRSSPGRELTINTGHGTRAAIAFKERLADDVVRLLLRLREPTAEPDVLASIQGLFNVDKRAATAVLTCLVKKHIVLAGYRPWTSAARARAWSERAWPDLAPNQPKPTTMLRPDSLVLPPRDLVLSLTNESGAWLRLSWGSGSARAVVDTDSTDVAAALVRQRVEMTLQEFTACLAEELPHEHGSVVAMVTDLAQRGFFGDGESEGDDAGHGASDGDGESDGDSEGDRDNDNDCDWESEGDRDSDSECEGGRDGDGGSDGAGPRPEPAARSASVSLVDIMTIARQALTRQRSGPFVGYFLLDDDGLDCAPSSSFAAYAYDPDSGALRSIKAEQATDLSDVIGGGVAFVLAVDWNRHRMPRAYRRIFAAAEAIMHTAIVAAKSLGLKAIQAPAIDESRIARLLRLDPSVIDPVALVSFGTTRS